MEVSKQTTGLNTFFIAFQFVLKLYVIKNENNELGFKRSS